MDDWGNGILMARRDIHIIDNFDEALGLRELRAKVNGKAGIKDEHPPNRFSIQAERCYGSKSIEIVRKWLDSGMLEKFYEEEFHAGGRCSCCAGSRCWNGEDYYRFNVLLACLMTIGAKLPSRMTESLEKMFHPAYLKLVKEKHPSHILKPLALAQIKKAVSGYKYGEPYDFGNKSFLESFHGSMFPGKTSKVIDAGSCKIIITTAPNGKVIPQIIGPPTDEEMGQVPMYPAHLCATCGKDKKPDGEDLLVCASCHDRKYCSKDCQKKHWKKHKIICKHPAVEMEAFLASIPLNFEDDIKQMKDAMKNL